LFLVQGCAAIGAAGMVLHANCNVRINNRCVKGSCELINGVFFERLTLMAKDSAGMPLEYVVTERFAGYNPGAAGAQKFWPDKLYFDKPNGNYKWNADTVDIHFKVTGYTREIISVQKKPANYNDQFILNSRNYETCPIDFHKDTWYLVRISDRRIRRIYLYVDQKKKFHVYQTQSGISPI